MKKILLPLLALLIIVSCSKDDSAKLAETSYITDADFVINVSTWETWGDITDDGITQNILLESGIGGVATFTKLTGDLNSGDDIEVADSSIDGLLVFNNYWDGSDKVIDFTVDNKYTIQYDSRNDSQAGYYEVSTTTGHYTKIN